MRFRPMFTPFTLLCLAATLCAAAPAKAQGSGSSIGGGSGATLSRTEGAASRPGMLSPAAVEPLWSTVQSILGRYRLPGWTRTRELGGGSPAALPTRKRAAGGFPG